MLMTTALSPSLLERAEALKLAPFESWPEKGLPEGYFAPEETARAASFFRENGFVVLDRALTPTEVGDLNKETARLCRNEKGEIAGIAPASADESDDEVMRRVLCVHFPHKLSPLMTNVLAHGATVDLLTKAIGPDVKCMQSMLFVKASGKPGQAWHQDEDYIPTRDRSLTGAWIALDDATVLNGCLWVLPKSQRPGILWPQREHDDEEHVKFDCANESHDFPWRNEDSVPVEVKAGSIVFFNGYLLHRSLPNRAATGFRRSLVNHYMSAASLLPWMSPEKIKGLVATADYRDIVMVAGTDPYAWKGTAEIAKASVRPSGEGGCESWGGKPAKKAKA
ncbi:MAG: phytanoyl-CoA dioxygenase family protein [Methylacidiphilales bacterium]|nr:phytanoyl-CoA dioxygenase family protein [Candidatus Methylacidiphilales bacterium]